MNREARKNHEEVINSGKQAKPKHPPTGNKAVVAIRHAVEDHQSRKKARDYWSYE